MEVGTVKINKEDRQEIMGEVSINVDISEMQGDIDRALVLIEELKSLGCNVTEIKEAE